MNPGREFLPNSYENRQAAEKFSVNPKTCEIPSQLQQRRLLTEVHHLMKGMDQHGNIDPAVLADVSVNLETATCEIAMPGAVTTTLHRVEERHDPEEKRTRRFFMFLGKTAVETAESGRKYHFSEPGLKRVDVEIDEANFNEREMVAGSAYVFLSPKMSRTDAPEDVAKAEHLADDDSIRVSYPITNSKGEIVARKMQSLLVSDIELDDWYTWLKDPSNIFGKSFTFDDETSALPIMKLFRELVVPEDQMPEGPVSIIADVVRFMKSPEAKQKVAEQLKDFRTNQENYRKEAATIAKEWRAFDIELAKSLKAEKATFEVRRFIFGLQEQWNDDTLQILKKHALPNAQYKMTETLAAVLEKAKQNILGSTAGVAVGNKKILKQVDSKTAAHIQNETKEIRRLAAAGADRQTIAMRQANLSRMIAQQNFRVGGGCPGENSDNFGNDPNNANSLINSEDSWQLNGSKDNENKDKWQWKDGICRVDACPTRPGKTKVGPCDVCKKCQAKFDAGSDPTLEVPRQQEAAKNVMNLFHWQGENTNGEAYKKLSEHVGATALVKV